MAKQLISRKHNVICLFNDAFTEDVSNLKEDILTRAPGVTVSNFKIIPPCYASDLNNQWRLLASKFLREYAIASLEPDFVHISAFLADGWNDNSVSSIDQIGVHVPVSLTHHDLIPYVMPDLYLPPGWFRQYYLDRLISMKNADLFMAISNFSRDELINNLNIETRKVVNVSSAVDDFFVNKTLLSKNNSHFFANLGINPNFIFYAPGGFDPRKNLERLIRAYSFLPGEIQSNHQLVIGSKLDPGRRDILESFAISCGIEKSNFILTDYTTDDELSFLYRKCYLYIFPSLYEGFGLPILEAMACGAPVIASDCSSIPEVLGLKDALFNPDCETSILNAMLFFIRDEKARKLLCAHSAKQFIKFSWEKSASVAIDALESRHNELLNTGWKPTKKSFLPSSHELLKRLNSNIGNCTPSEKDIKLFLEAYNFNSKIIT
jgi:glycosyltransferase involved in cell wall biosynthesis